MDAKKIGLVNLFLIGYIFVSSIFTLFFWFTGEEALILYAKNLIQEGGITKLNSGILLLLSVLSIVFYHFKIRYYKVIIKVICYVVLAVSSITIIQYIFGKIE